MMAQRALQYALSILLLAVLFLFASPHTAQAADRQTVDGLVRWTIDGGGGSTGGSGYQLTGTIGQVDATHDSLMENGYGLRGGFWWSGDGRTPTALDPGEQPEGTELTPRIFLPMVQQ